MKKRNPGASPVSSDRQRWQKVFDTLVGFINKQQSQLHTQRKVFEDRIKTQQRIFDDAVDLLRRRISKMKGDLALQEMMSSLDAKKFEFAMGSKQRETLFHKLKLEEAELELADFKECLEILSMDAKDGSPKTSRSKGTKRKKSSRVSAKQLEDVHDHSLEEEIKRLKRDFDTLLSEKHSEVSALMAEKKFVWNQYNILETNLNDKLKSKEAEVQLAKEKVSKLLSGMEKLQALNYAKDQTIAKLENRIADKAALAENRGQEITRLAHELELLKRTKANMETPVLIRCTSTNTTTTSSSRRNKFAGASVTVNKQHMANNSEGGCGSKRKADEIDSIRATPKLFSSSFKIPKLKTQPIK